MSWSISRFRSMASFCKLILRGWWQNKNEREMRNVQLCGDANAQVNCLYFFPAKILHCLIYLVCLVPCWPTTDLSSDIVVIVVTIIATAIAVLLLKYNSRVAIYFSAVNKHHFVQTNEPSGLKHFSLFMHTTINLLCGRFRMREWAVLLAFIWFAFYYSNSDW